MSDPIADMLTRLRNANSASRSVVAIPFSSMKVEIARVLHEEGFVGPYEVTGEAPHQQLEVTLKPKVAEGCALNGLKRVSKPGLRVYTGKADIPSVSGGLGIAIVSTSRGLMTGQAARNAGLGGEVIAYVW